MTTTAAALLLFLLSSPSSGLHRALPRRECGLVWMSNNLPDLSACLNLASAAWRMPQRLYGRLPLTQVLELRSLAMTDLATHS